MECKWHFALVDVKTEGTYSRESRIFIWSVVAFLMISVNRRIDGVIDVCMKFVGIEDAIWGWRKLQIM